MFVQDKICNLIGALERVRGGPIAALSDAEITPSIEQSDSDLICKSPLVSVVMITYNHERFIREAIESIVKQMCDFDYELIIGEDCSSDLTREICFECQERYPQIVRVIWSAKNVGAGLNWRRVTQRARGKYLAICEGDDFWISQTKLQQQVEVLEKDEDVSIVYTDFDICLIDNRTKKNILKSAGILTKWSDYNREDFIHEIAFGDVFFATASIMIRTSLYLDYSSKEFVSQQLLSLGDMGIRVYAAKVGIPKCIPESMVVYRHNDSGITQSAPQSKHKLLVDILYMRLSLLRGYVADADLTRVLQWYLVKWTSIYMHDRFPWGVRVRWFYILRFCLLNGLVTKKTFRQLWVYIIAMPLPDELLSTLRKLKR